MLELVVVGTQGSFRRCTVHPSSLPLSHNPKLLLPDTTALPGNASTEAVLWQSQHTKGSLGGMLEHFWGEPEGVGQTQRVWGERSRGDQDLGDAGKDGQGEASSYCPWVLSGPPGVLGQWNSPSWASEDPGSL